MSLKTQATCDCCGEVVLHDKTGYPEGWRSAEIVGIQVTFCGECARILRSPTEFFVPAREEEVET